LAVEARCGGSNVKISLSAGVALAVALGGPLLLLTVVGAIVFKDQIIEHSVFVVGGAIRSWQTTVEEHLEKEGWCARPDGYTLVWTRGADCISQEPGLF